MRPISKDGCLRGAGTPAAPAPGPPHHTPPSSPRPADSAMPAPGRKLGRGRRPEAHTPRRLPATQGLRRGGGARRGERRLLTGGACALGALIVPRGCRTARQPPIPRVSLRESGGGCGACGRPRGLLLLPVPLTPTRHSFPHFGSVTRPSPTLRTRMPCPEQPSSA